MCRLYRQVIWPLRVFSRLVQSLRGHFYIAPNSDPVCFGSEIKPLLRNTLIRFHLYRKHWAVCIDISNQVLPVNYKSRRRD